MTAFVRTTIEAGVAVVALDRPDVRNALTPDMLEAVREAPSVAERDGARCVLLRGAGPAFCAGFDLTLCQDDDNAVGVLLTGLSHAIAALRDGPLPVVLCAHGAAIAGGAALLGGADIVVADASAKIGYPVLRLGISPAVSAPFLRLGVGDGACRTRLIDTKIHDAVAAERIGLVHELTPNAEAAQAKATEIARSLASKPPSAIAATKRWLNELDQAAGDVRARALEASLSLTGGAEERERLIAMWNAGR